MGGMDPDPGGRVERRREEGKAHYVVPVQVRLEEIMRPPVARGASLQRVQPKFPEAAAHVADEKAVTAFDLDAGSCAAIGSAGCEIELLVNEGVGLLEVCDRMTVGGNQGARDLGADGAGLGR